MAPSRATSRLAAAALRRATHQPQPQHTFRRQLGATSHYHSHDHPPPAGDFGTAEQAILSAAYRHVPEHGFTAHALSLGARDAGYLDISTNLLPEGPFSLIRYHLVTQREALAPRSAAVFQEGAASSLQVPDKVERLAWERLLGNTEVNHRWQEVRTIDIHTYTHNPGIYGGRESSSTSRSFAAAG